MFFAKSMPSVVTFIAGPSFAVFDGSKLPSWLVLSRPFRSEAGSIPLVARDSQARIAPQGREKPGGEETGRGERQMVEQVVVGIDVSKAKLDVAIWPGGEQFTVSNDRHGLGDFDTVKRPLSIP